MELEVKHVAPYLPYKLNVLSGDAKEIYELSGITMRDGWVNYERRIEIFGENSPRYYTQELKYCKPILRPISDLRKIEFIEKLYEVFGGGYSSKTAFMNAFIGRNADNIIYSTYTTLTYETMQFLFEHHFDVFGLIEQGLAIDINTIKQ